MKSHFPSTTLAFFAGCSIFGFSQNEPSDVSKRSAAEVIASHTCIPNDLAVSAFIPPAPPVEKKVPVMRIDAAVTVPTGNSLTLTILRAEASELPDIPIPPEPVLQELRPLTPEELARQAEERRRHLILVPWFTTMESASSAGSTPTRGKPTKPSAVST